jgi:hypothetical protein
MRVSHGAQTSPMRAGRFASAAFSPLHTHRLFLVPGASLPRQGYRRRRARPSHASSKRPVSASATVIAAVTALLWIAGAACVIGLALPGCGGLHPGSPKVTCMGCKCSVRSQAHVPGPVSIPRLYLIDILEDCRRSRAIQISSSRGPCEQTQAIGGRSMDAWVENPGGHLAAMSLAALDKPLSIGSNRWCR